MHTTWIVLAHRSGARFFARDSRRRQPVFQGELSAAAAGQRAGTKVNYSVSERETFGFARDLARFLDDVRGQRYNDLVLVADPHFLELLRCMLSVATNHVVTTTIPKDLGEAVPTATSLRWVEESAP